MKEVRLIFQEGTSNKFWNASVDGAEFTVHYGRIGTDGQKQVKTLGSPSEAEKAFDKKVAEKRKEGYADAGDGAEISASGSATTRPLGENNFAGRSIRKFDPEKKLQNLDKAAYKLNIEYDGGVAMTELLSKYLEDPSAAQTEALIFGMWDEESSVDSSALVEMLVSAREKLPALRALFIGDMESEECEISWINQSDLAPLFLAFPKLEHFAVRGGTGLSIGKIKHAALKSIIIETGGLPSAVVRDVCSSDLPALEYLEVWFGDDNYGGDASIGDLKELLSGQRFPKLKYLGLCNAMFSDDIAAAVAKSPLLDRIEILDLSMGTLGDEGARALVGCPAVKKLKKLDLDHHYMSDEVVAEIKKLGVRVDLEKADSDDDDPENRYVEVAE